MRLASVVLSSLMLLVGVVAAAAGQNPPTSADAQKLEAAWAPLRERNARDYAIATAFSTSSCREFFRWRDDLTGIH